MAIPNGQAQPILVRGTGTLSFNNGLFMTASAAYVIARPGSKANGFFNNGSARIYDRRPVLVFGSGKAMTVLGQSGYASDWRLRPWGAFKDFTIFRVNDPINTGIVLQDDLGVQNNPTPIASAVASSAGTGPEGTMIAQPWTRHSRVVVPPKRAAYAVPQPIVSLASGKSAYLDGHQMEIVQTAVQQASAFSSARSLNVFPRPYQINFCENPNGRVGTNYWGGVATGATGPNGGGLYCSSGSATVWVAHPNIQQQYTVSAVVWGNSAPVTFTGIGTGVTTTTVPIGTDNVLSMIYATYTPIEVSTNIGLTSTGSFNVNNVQVTAGSKVLPYFDGDSGNDFLWENGGSAQLSRSYWYPGRLKRHGVMVKNLQDNMPFGMVINQVTYAMLPKPDGDILFNEGYYGGGVYE